MTCINTNSVEYRDLQKVSTLSDNILNMHCAKFYKEHGRLPRLDEIPGNKSSEYLKKQLKINQYDGVETKLLLDFTLTDNVLQATININKRFLDLETETIDLGESVIVKTKQRPDILSKRLTEIYEPDEKVSNSFLIQGLNKLRNLYGIDIIEVSNYDLETEQFAGLMPSNKLVKAFIYNGNIYINTDNASADSKVHELLHLLVGSMRFSNPDLYMSLINSITLIPNIDYKLDLYRDKTRNDALEEIFVSEVAKYLVGMDSSLNGLDKEIVYEINYNIKRTLDTILNGDYSTKIIENERLVTMSLREVAEEVNSEVMTSPFYSMYEGSDMHRKLANKKNELLKKGELIENCGV